MKKKWIDIVIKIVTVFLIIGLLMYESGEDIPYIYAGF